MKQNISIQEYYKTILHLYQLKKKKYFSGTARINLWKSNGISKENIQNIVK